MVVPTKTHVGALMNSRPAALNSSAELPKLSSNGVTLFTNVACPYAQRAHISLLESGHSFDAVEIDLNDKPKWYPSVNPRSKVPALIDNTPGNTKPGDVLIESALITQYLADQFGHKLNGKTPYENYVGRLFVDNVNNSVGGNLFKILGNRDAAKEDELKKLAGQIVREIDDQLTSNGVKSADSTSPWILGGDNPSIFDMLTIPHVARFMDQLPYFTGWDHPDAPAVWRFVNAWEERSSFQTTWPGSQFLRDGVEGKGWAVKRNQA